MKRLTFDGNFCDIAQCREGTCLQGGCCSQREVWDRLKAIEDILGAEYRLEQVKFVPCKVGDTMYGIKYYNQAFKIRKGRVSELSYLDDMRLCISLHGVCRGEYGKKVFSTQEEAEAEMRKWNGRKE